MPRKKMPCSPSPVSDRDLGDALRAIFRSQSEIDEMFAEFEAAFLRAAAEAAERAKQTRR
jgi:hypothetical protein